MWNEDEETSLADPLGLRNLSTAAAPAPTPPQAPAVQGDVRLETFREYFKIALGGTSQFAPRNDTPQERARAARLAVDQAAAIADLVGPLLEQRRRTATQHAWAENVRPQPGRVYEFVRDFTRLTTLTESGFQNHLRDVFTHDAYSAFIAGEWTHDGVGEQDLVTRMFDFVAGLFPNGTFALREENIGGTPDGIYTSERTGTARALVRSRGIRSAILADGDQFRSNTWVPGLLARNGKFFSYTGSAHTSQAYVTFFSRGLPDQFRMSAGPGILDTARGERKKGIVLACAMANEFLVDFELQAIKEKLHEFPDAFTFENWTAAFAFDFNALFASFSAPRITCISPDVYVALIPPYAGVSLVNAAKTAWSDARLGDRIRRDRSWTLYDLRPNYIRFQDDAHPGHRFLEADIGSSGLTGAPREQTF
jgi:hypothetical protein